MKKPITLLRCPFCGGKPRYEFTRDGQHHIWCRKCNDPHVFSSPVYRTVRWTKTYWNESIIKWQSDYIDINNPYDRAKLIKMTMGPQPPFILAEQLAKSFPFERPSLISEWGSTLIKPTTLNPLWDKK